MAYISLDFEAYRHNLEYLAKKVGDISKLMVVLKDNAYGHGLKEMAPLAAAVGVKRAVVKNIHEARVVAPFFEKVLILIEPNLSECVVHEKLIYSACELKALEIMPKNTIIHLKIDTNMSRNGIKIDELKRAFEIIVKKELKLEGVFTHFYAADILSADTFVQRELFEDVKKQCKALSKTYNLEIPYFHSCNSSALLRYEGEFKDDFARVGIASYGYSEIDRSIGSFDLKPVLALWANRVSSRNIKKGDKIGYGGTFLATKDMRVSTYDVGYGDGLFRLDGKKALHVKSKKPLLGRTSMDLISVEGDDEVICVFDDVSECAKVFETISYEVLTRLSPTLKRVVENIN